MTAINSRKLMLMLCLASALSIGAQEGRSDEPPRIPSAVFVPTPHDIVAEMLALARVAKDDVVYDLGCGDGRIVVAAAKRHGCRAVGVDIDPLRVEQSRASVEANGLAERVRIDRGDLFEVDLSEATVVMLYLSSRHNARLVPQLQRLKPGARVVSHQFPIPGVKPAKAIRVRSKEDGRDHLIYLWTTPLSEARPRPADGSRRPGPQAASRLSSHFRKGR